MIGIKVIKDFQNPQFLIANDVELKPKTAISMFESTPHKVFDFFQHFVDISTDLTFNNQYFFPVFLKATGYDRDQQVADTLAFINKNQDLFRTKKLILLMVEMLEAWQDEDLAAINNLAANVSNICTVYHIDGDRKRNNKNTSVKHYSALHWIHHTLNDSPNSVLPLNNEHRTFIFLNKMARPHRVKTISKILDAGLRNDGYITFTKEITCCRDWPQRYPNVLKESFDILDFRNVLKKNPTQHVPVEYCKKSFLFLNTETYCDSERLFLTEKTFKPLRIGMPFITVSHPGTLEYLKSLGFYTFSEWIDETYDLEQNEDKKINLIINEVKRLSELSPNQRLRIREDMIPVLTHNKNLIDKLTNNTPEIMSILTNIEQREKI